MSKTLTPSVKNVTTLALLVALSGIKEERDIQMTTSTKCDLSEATLASLGFVAVNKRSTIHSGKIAQNYSANVNAELKRRHKKADFVSAGRAWGEKIAPCIVGHKDKYYVEVHNPEAVLPQYVGIKADGSEVLIPREKVEPFLVRRSSSSSRQAAKGIGVKFQNTVITYKLESVNEIRIIGEGGKVESHFRVTA
jgi:hypothetical protein